MRSTYMYAAAMLAAFSIGCGNGKKEVDEEPAERAVVLGPESWTVVKVSRIESGPTLSGTLRPKREATLRAQVPGAVTGTFADGGQAVGAGTLLATIDTQTVSTQVDAARAAVATAESNLKLSTRELERLGSLLEAGAIAERDVEAARRNLVAAQSAVTQTRAQLTAAQRQMTYTQVRSPFSGKVSVKLVGTGDIVQPGTAMYTVIDPSSLQLEAQIPTEQISQIKVGDDVEFRINGIADRVYHGRITRINPSVDPTTRQVRVYAEIPNAGNDLLADLFAEGSVTTQVRNTTTVPARAIDRRQMTPAVARVKNGRPERVEVRLGMRDTRGDRFEILGGVNPGDTILVGAGVQTTPGTLVTLSTTSRSTSGASAAGGKPGGAR